MSLGVAASKPFRFAIQGGPFDDPAALRDYARKLEDLGYTELWSYDHLGAVDPFLPLLVATEATTTLRVGPLVLNNEFHNPVLLARTAATFDRLSGGRLILGMGTGYMRSEHDAADIELRPPGSRVTRFTESIEVLRSLLDTGSAQLSGVEVTAAVDDLGVRPAQDRVPILIGGNGRRVVGLAGRLADIFQYTGLVHDPVTGTPSAGAFDSASVTDRHRWLIDAAADRLDEIEISTLVQVTKVGRGAAAARRDAIERTSLKEKDADETPFVLIGSKRQVVDKLHQMREQFGIHHILTRDPDDFAPIVAELAGT